MEIEDEEEKEEEKNKKLYKFRTGLANIFKFYDWANEKEIKKHVSDYIVKNRLYNRSAEEIEVYK